MTQNHGLADLHMHTNVSDGAATVRDLLAHAAALPLDVIAITDHDRLDASLYAYEHQDKYPFEVVPGLEVTSREGHVLAWYVTEKIPMHLSLEETVQAVHELGGIATLAHPYQVYLDETRAGYQRYAGDPDLIARCGFDAVEAVNAAAIIPGLNVYTRYRVGGLGLSLTGSSDAHTLNAIGSGRTRYPGKTAADLRHALETQQTVAVNGSWSPWAYVSYFRCVRNGTISFEHIQPGTA